jgi:hypothetical protein
MCPIVLLVPDGRLVGAAPGQAYDDGAIALPEDLDDADEELVHHLLRSQSDPGTPHPTISVYFTGC